MEKRDHIQYMISFGLLLDVVRQYPLVVKKQIYDQPYIEISENFEFWPTAT